VVIPVLLGLYRPAPSASARLAVVRDDLLVDVHGACWTDLARRAGPRRARELADAFCPPGLVAFLENGPSGWSALLASLDHLGVALYDPQLRTPAGDVVVHWSPEVERVPIVPWEVRLDPPASRDWQDVALAGSVGRLLTDGGVYLPEFFAVIGRPARHVEPAEVWSCVALVSEHRPATDAGGGVLRTVDELDAADLVLRARIEEAVVAAGAGRTLLPGDVVRTGIELVARPAGGGVAAARPTTDDLVPAW
jgi:hypothetical protein